LAISWHRYFLHARDRTKSRSKENSDSDRSRKKKNSESNKSNRLTPATSRSHATVVSRFNRSRTTDYFFHNGSPIVLMCQLMFHSAHPHYSDRREAVQQHSGEMRQGQRPRQKYGEEYGRWLRGKKSSDNRDRSYHRVRPERPARETCSRSELLLRL
jgi:hypothetical protein